MSTIIEKQFDFQAGVYFQEAFLMNIYDFTICMEVNTDNIREQNIAMERIKFLINEYMENVVFFSESEIKLVSKYNDCGIKTCMLPQEPYDQIVALALLLKFNAVCENRIKMLDIRFTSKLSDGVIFNEDIETAKKTFLQNGWWSDINPTLDSFTNNKKEKVVKLMKDSWASMGLSWKECKSEPTEITFSVDLDR